jgi:hypothetical protein
MLADRRWIRVLFVNTFSCRFYPRHAKNHYSHPNTCITKLPTLGEVVCTKSLVKRLTHSVSDRGELMSSNRTVKPQHLCSENRKSANALSALPSTIPDPLFQVHPRQSTQNAFSYRFYPTHSKNNCSHPNTCITKLSIYMLIYIVVVGKSRIG